MDGYARGRALPDQGGARHNLTFVIGNSPRDLPTALLKEHYDEIAEFKNVLQLDPDWREYDALSRSGQLITVLACSEGHAVGYMILIVKPHLHYRNATVAIDDVHFLRREFRGIGAGKAMVAFAEKSARDAGATLFSMRCKADPDKEHGRLFEGMGYTLTDLVYVKDLTHEQ
jgi:GNAT superfamily N-acetyltransferase